MASNLKAFVQGSAILTISNTALMAISFFLLPLYTIHLTTTELGINDSITTFTTLFSVLLVLGLDSAYSAFFYDVDTEEYKASVFSTIWLALAAVSIIPVLLMTISPLISQMLFHTREYYGVICVALGNIALILFSKPFQLDLRIRSKMTLFSVVTVATSALNVLCSVLFVVVFDLAFWSFILAAFISNAFQFIVYRITVHNRISFKLFDLTMLRSMLKYGLPLVPVSVAYWLINVSCTLFLLEFFSAAEVGIFGIAHRCASAMAAITSAIQVSYTAYAFQTVHEEGAQDKLRRMANALFVLVAFLAFSGTMFGKEIIHVMTEQSYHGAYIMLPCLLFGQLASFMSNILAYGINFTKQTKYSLYAATTAALLSVVINFLLVPRLSGLGASFSVLACHTCLVTLHSIFSERLFPCGYNFKRLLAGYIGLGLLAGLTFQMWFVVKLGVWIAGTLLLCLLFKDSIRELKNLLAGRRKNKARA